MNLYLIRSAFRAPSRSCGWLVRWKRLRGVTAAMKLCLDTGY